MKYVLYAVAFAVLGSIRKNPFLDHANLVTEHHGIDDASIQNDGRLSFEIATKTQTDHHFLHEDRQLPVIQTMLRCQRIDDWVEI